MGHFNERNLPMDEIVKEYLGGVTANKLATKYGCTCHTILKRLRKCGVETRKQAESYSTMSEADRAGMTLAAHNAIRGKLQKESSKVQRALTVESNAAHGRGISILEERFTDWFLETRSDIEYTPHKAVHVYNIDVALTENRVAVEIFGGGWHAGGRHAVRFRKRTEHLLGAGWTVLIIWVTDVYPLTQAAVNYAIALHDVRRSDESKPTEQHVIWGTGEPIPVDQLDPDTGARKVRFHGYNRLRNHDGRFGKYAKGM